MAGIKALYLGHNAREEPLAIRDPTGCPLGGNFWSFEPWPKRCGMVAGQEQRVMVTATWRADHLRHEIITRRVVGDDHVRGDWWLIRQGNARKKWHRNATLFGPCPTRTLLVYL
ncbi:hypothetical protein NC651_005985 [Populus alba x Populus x berolinensis]|nr:hypothetical protein NC651_005985 [Populus alba x Populus x berolinensis]